LEGEEFDLDRRDRDLVLLYLRGEGVSSPGDNSLSCWCLDLLLAVGPGLGEEDNAVAPADLVRFGFGPCKYLLISVTHAVDGLFFFFLPSLESELSVLLLLLLLLRLFGFLCFSDFGCMLPYSTLGATVTSFSIIISGELDLDLGEVFTFSNGLSDLWKVDTDLSWTSENKSLLTLTLLPLVLRSLRFSLSKY